MVKRLIMTRKKKILIISISSSLAVAIAVVFIALACTIWKPKSTQEWLNDFKACLTMQKDDSEQKTERSISITEDGTEVARYYQIVEVRNQNEENVAHLSVIEKFPTLDTTDFDTYDEYYFIGGTMYMQRIAAGETNGTSFGSTLEIFWEVVSENLGSVNYNFTESNFTNLELTHEKNIHKLSALISEADKQSFFEGAENLLDMREISITMTYEDSGHCEMQIKYKYHDKQSVTIEIVKSEPIDIEIKDFVQR